MAFDCLFRIELPLNTIFERAQRHWVIVGNPGCRRVEGFLGRLDEYGQKNIDVIAYRDLILGRVDLATKLSSDSILRIESAAEQIETRQLLMMLGRQKAIEEGSPVADESDIDIERKQGNFSHPLWSRQIYNGFCDLLFKIGQHADSSKCNVMNAPSDTAILFDKARCQKLFSDHRISIPSFVGQPRNYDEVRSMVRDVGRGMLKTAHGSGASGCIALHSQGDRIRGLTPLRPITIENRSMLYCRTSISVYTDELELAAIVNRLCQEHCHLEKWLPKAKFGNRNFDVRVVTIDVIACHRVARLSHGPFTNLNLKNERIPLDTLASETRCLDTHTLNRLNEISEMTASLFPRSIVLGVDALISPNGQIAILEANAFGDLLPGVYHRGQDTYSVEIRVALERWKAKVGLKS